MILQELYKPKLGNLNLPETREFIITYLKSEVNKNIYPMFQNNHGVYSLDSPAGTSIRILDDGTIRIMSRKQRYIHRAKSKLLKMINGLELN
ncbi:MAG: hypothetical protein WC438_00510 [Candidatus Pacearchaeota archaeon]